MPKYQVPANFWPKFNKIIICQGPARETGLFWPKERGPLLGFFFFLGLIFFPFSEVHYCRGYFNNFFVRTSKEGKKKKGPQKQELLHFYNKGWLGVLLGSFKEKKNFFFLFISGSRGREGRTFCFLLIIDENQLEKVTWIAMKPLY